MHRTTGPAVALAGVLLAVAATACGGGGDGSSDAGQPAPAFAPDRPEDGAVFEDYGVNPEVNTEEDNQSTFALDVDTGSYTVTRGYLRDGFLPDPAAVRTEEFVNYFAHDYQPPEHGIGIHVDGAPAPFLDGAGKRVIRVGLQAAVVDDGDRRPANLTFVVDTSGSMEGENIEMVRIGLNRLLDTLRTDDAVAIVTFSDQAELRLPMTPMTEERAIRDAVGELEPQANTNVEAGLRVGYEHAQATLRPDGVNRVVLFSDGAANEGETDPQVLADQIAQAAGRTTQLVVVGVGRGTYDEAVLEQFADNGNGMYAYIDGVREAERLFVHDLTGTLEPVALDAKVQVTFDPDVVTAYRLLGFENRQIDDGALRDDTVDGGEVGAGHNVTALYEVTLREGGTVSGTATLATVDLVWVDPNGQGAERSVTLTADDLVDSFQAAPDRLRQDLLVAAFAECLRDAPWSERVSLAQVADNVAVLAELLPGDEQVADLVELTRTAADLAG